MITVMVVKVIKINITAVLAAIVGNNRHLDNADDSHHHYHHHPALPTEGVMGPKVLRAHFRYLVVALSRGRSVTSVSS